MVSTLLQNLQLVDHIVSRGKFLMSQKKNQPSKKKDLYIRICLVIISNLMCIHIHKSLSCCATRNLFKLLNTNYFFAFFNV
jgi:hypothetical protein